MGSTSSMEGKACERETRCGFRARCASLIAAALASGLPSDSPDALRVSGLGACSSFPACFSFQFHPETTCEFKFCTEATSACTW
eukprot:2433897-Rhodomonas_salina.2